MNSLIDARGRLAALAVDQHGVVGHRQVERIGVSARQLERLAEGGWIERIGPQVYRVVGAPATWRSELAAGVLSLGPQAAVSHRAAAALYGLDRFERETLEFTVRRRRRGAAMPAAVVHTTLILPGRDIRIVDGLPVTTPVRTVIDLAGLRIRDAQVEAAIDSGARLGLLDLDALSKRLGELRGKGRAGVRRLDRMLISSGGHSFLEREFLKLIADRGLPAPSTQVVHERDGRHVARVDFLFERAGVVVEVSGRQGHSTPSDRARDARRRNELQQLGRVVVEFTHDDVMKRGPYVLRTLHALLDPPRAA